MILNDLERRDAMCQIFQPDLLNNARTVRPRTTKFGRITHVGRGIFLEGQPRPHRKGAYPSAPQIWGSFYLCVPPLTQNDQIWRCDMIWRGLLVSTGSAAVPSKRGGAPAVANFAVLLYLRLHPLTQNIDVRQGNACAGEAWFLGSITPRIPLGVAPALLNFVGSPLFMSAPFDI